MLPSALSRPRRRCNLRQNVGPSCQEGRRCSQKSGIAKKSYRIVSSASGVIFDPDGKLERLSELEELLAAPNLWDDNVRAQQLLKEQKDLQNAIKAFTVPESLIEDVDVLCELGEEDEDEDESISAEASRSLDKVQKALDALEFQRMLGGPQDRMNAIVNINAGAGGTESLDWAGMLQRMYLRYCDIKGWKAKLLDEQEGDEAGIKSATFSVAGDYAFGMLSAESGIHRLVRISPFDAAARRHTSFASVFVYPEVDDTIDIEVNENDLKIDTYRAGGAGGQHVNKTDSAVRITHLPSGIVVQCQNERSQIKNRSTAMKLLKSRLYDLELQKRRDAADALHDTKKDISFGSQIRSYVLQPYRMVKDHRTGHEVGNADAVLDGDLDGFIEAYLISRPARD